MALLSLNKATVEKSTVNNDRLRTIDSKVTPNGLKSRIKPSAETIIMLRTMLSDKRVILYMLLGSPKVRAFDGDIVLKRAYPGRKRTRMEADTYRI